MFLTYVPTLIAFFYPNAKNLFSILGAFFGTMIIVTIPGYMYCYYLYNWSDWNTLKLGFFASWAILFTLFGFICGFNLIFGKKD